MVYDRNKLFTCVVAARECYLHLCINDTNLVARNVDGRYEGGCSCDTRHLAGVHHVHPHPVPARQERILFPVSEVGSPGDWTVANDALNVFWLL